MIKKDILKCFVCGGKSVLYFSHSYQYTYKDMNFWSSRYYELCDNCKSFTELDSRRIDIRTYRKRYALTKQLRLFGVDEMESITVPNTHIQCKGCVCVCTILVPIDAGMPDAVSKGKCLYSKSNNKANWEIEH